MSRDVTNIYGERADFASDKEVVSFFIGLFLSEKGFMQAYFLDKIPQPTPTQSWPKVEFSGYFLEFFCEIP